MVWCPVFVPQSVHSRPADQCDWFWAASLAESPAFTQHSVCGTDCSHIINFVSYSA